MSLQQTRKAVRYEFSRIAPNSDKRVYVHSSNGDNDNNGSNPGSAVADLATAMDLCEANSGYEIHLLDGHAESGNAFALDTAGVAIIGHGWGAARPTFTATTGSANTFDVSAASVYLENVIIRGGVLTQTALIDVAADDFIAKNVELRQGAGQPTIAVTVAGADRFWFDDCTFLGTAAGPDVGIDIESGDSADWKVTNCVFNYAGSGGLDLAGIRASFQQTGGLVLDNHFIAMDVTAIDINSSVSAQGDGLIAHNTVAGGAAISNIDTAIDAGGYILVENYGSDSATAAGGLIPVATPA